MNDHPFTPEDIAAYAIGASPSVPAANCVSEHLTTCPECRAEYEGLRPVVTALAESAEAPQASPLLKARVMRAVRGSAKAPPHRAERAPARPVLWPAYLVAAACLVIALISTVQSISLIGQLRDAQGRLATLASSLDGVAREDAADKTMLTDLLSADATHYAFSNGQAVTLGSHLYLTLHGLRALPRNHVYQAWTMRAGAKAVTPSSTFVPDTRGVAIVALPQDARTVRAVAISVEPDGGSKQPTTKPIATVSLGG